MTVVFEGDELAAIKKEADALRSAFPAYYIVDNGPVSVSANAKINEVKGAARFRDLERALDLGNAFVICICSKNFLGVEIERQCKAAYRNLLCVENDMHMHVKIVNAVKAFKAPLLHVHQNIVQDILTDRDMDNVSLYEGLKEDKKKRFNILLVELLRNDKVYREDLTITKNKRDSHTDFLVSCYGKTYDEILLICESIKRYIVRELSNKSYIIYLNAILLKEKS